MLAVAHALGGLNRAEAARLVGLERQALRDAVVRYVEPRGSPYNTEGLEGLRDRPKPGRPSTLSEPEQAVLVTIILRGPDLERDGGAEWTLPMLCRWIEGRFDKRLQLAGLSRVVRGLDLSRQKTRPRHPEADEAAKAAFKGELRHDVAAIAADRPSQRIEPWFQDEARVGQKGRTCHRWWARGQRPRGLFDQRYDWTYLYTAVRPATGEGFALVLPVVSATAMAVFLEHFAASLAPDVHAVLVLDQAGWHGSRRLHVPDNVPWFRCRPTHLS